MHMAWTVFPSRLALGRELLLPRAPGPRILLPWREAARQASSSTRWKQRQTNDVFAREAKVQGLKSRAAFKLLEMDAKYHLFKKGQVVVDLGFAPGSWSQVAVERTKPSGRVVGIDILPAQPPKGVSTIQGNFLSPVVRAMVKEFLLESDQRQRAQKDASGDQDGDRPEAIDPGASETSAGVIEPASYLEMERRASHVTSDGESAESTGKDGQDERLVDVVLSDMSAPWPQLHGFSANSINNPYRRMMNTSGISFKDHAGSMDLCASALAFASETLRDGGHFVCKFYQGAEDKALEKMLRKMFAKVHREKPESSRSESRENFFVALRRKGNVTLTDAQAD